MSRKKLTEKLLSNREREVLRWMGEGKSNREIGETLGIACGTVRKHADHIYRKLGVNNRTAAAMWARNAAGA